MVGKYKEKLDKRRSELLIQVDPQNFINLIPYSFKYVEQNNSKETLPLHWHCKDKDIIFIINVWSIIS